MNDTRAKAGAILSAAKMRMLEDAGITVVTNLRLEALERLYEAAKLRNAIIAEVYDPDFDWDYADEKEREKANEWAVDNTRRIYEADEDMDAAIAELEAMEK